MCRLREGWTYILKIPDRSNSKWLNFRTLLTLRRVISKKIARLKLGNIAHLKKQLTSVYFLRPSISTIVPQRI